MRELHCLTPYDHPAHRWRFKLKHREPWEIWDTDDEDDPNPPWWCPGIIRPTTTHTRQTRVE